MTLSEVVTSMRRENCMPIADSFGLEARLPKVRSKSGLHFARKVYLSEDLTFEIWRKAHDSHGGDQQSGELVQEGVLRPNSEGRLQLSATPVTKIGAYELVVTRGDGTRVEILDLSEQEPTSSIQFVVVRLPLPAHQFLPHSNYAPISLLVTPCRRR